MSRRLFVALVPPSAVRAEARRAAGHLRLKLPRMEARYADPSTTHLTLAFLGHVAETDVSAVRLAVAGVARTARPFVAHTSALGAFPNPRRPSVLWLGLHDERDALAELQRGLAAALTGAGGDPDRKRFVPHLTLARVRALHGIDRSLVADTLAAFEPAAAPWPVGELVLFESELRREGARHTALLRAPLGQPDTPPRGNAR